MLLLPLMLGACNPEHNPSDLARIDRLQTTNDRLDTELKKQDGELQAYQAAVSEQNTMLGAYQVVARAWLTDTKQPGAQVVVCQPTPVSEFVDPSQGIPTAPTHTEPWVQVEVTADCNMPLVLDLSRDPEVPDVLAALDPGEEAYDGPTLENAPVVEEDME